MDVFVFASRCALGWIFLAAGLSKIRSRSAFRDDLKRYPKPIARTARPLSTAVPVLEIALAFGFMSGVGWRAAAVAAALILAGFSAAAGGAWVRGARGDCGCGGLLPSQRFGPHHLAQNMALALFAGGLATLDASAAALPGAIPILSQDRTSLSISATIFVPVAALNALVVVASGASVLESHRARILEKRVLDSALAAARKAEVT